ncbi:MAG: hypothetical protein ACE5EQ_12240 [Phycisphaerae bacterium]
MLATTWVQITKAVLLMVGIAYMAWMVLQSFEFDFSGLFAAAMANHDEGRLLVGPGGLHLDFLSGISLAMALGFGIVGSPHRIVPGKPGRCPSCSGHRHDRA